MRKWVIILLLVVAAGMVGFYYIQAQGGLANLTGQALAQATPTPLPPIQANPDIIVDAVVVPVRTASLSFGTTGIVAEILVAEGDTVETGQVIARLENERQVIAIAQSEARVRSVQARLDELRAGTRSEELAAAQAGVDIAQARLDSLLDGARSEDIASAQATLNAAQANLQQVLAGADEADLVAALANLSNAEATMRQAQRAYDQVSWQTDIAAMPQSAELQRATNNYEAARATYDLLAAGAKQSQVAAARAEVERAQAALDKVRSPSTANELAAAEAEVRRAQSEFALRQAGARPETVAAAEAELTEAAATLMQRQLELSETELRARFSGVVAALNLEIGELVSAAAPVAQLADQSEWRIETDDLTEINVVFVQEGDPVDIQIDALPDLDLQGTILRIKPLGESKQGDITYTATIRPDRMDSRLRWNMTASVTIRLNR
jgi:HlyD family secretion protein